MLFNAAGELLEEGGAALAAAFRGPGQFLWLDVQGDDTPEMLRVLDAFELNPLAHRDSQRPRHPPKYEAFDEHIFMVMHELVIDASHTAISRQPLSLFANNGYDVIVTVGVPLPSTASTRRACDGCTSLAMVATTTYAAAAAASRAAAISASSG